MSEAAVQTEILKTTPLHALHVELGAKMVPFAGYDMPVQYPDGVLSEHLHTRAAAGLFDVSHMGQAYLVGPDHASVCAAIEALVPGDILGLEPTAIRYTLLLNDKGGIRDDLMVTRTAKDGTLFLVVNAACKDADFAHIAGHLPKGIELHRLEDRALIALQGPKAAAVFARFAPGAAAQDFMTGLEMTVAGIPCLVSRSGYTGEDGYEISVPEAEAVALTKKLLAEPEVKPIGLGARDSLRLEAGLCLYGHDIDETTTPVEGALTWTISKRRREEGNFPGAKIILDQIASGVTRKRVGLLPEGKAPAREGTEITDASGRKIGVVTSGGYGPSVGGPIAMGYVETAHAKAGTGVELMVRGKGRPAKVVAMPFVEKRFHKPGK
ncbi:MULTISPECIES: glycine cleavage system aminomethyltransferase GcvT [Alphaproteobacteria]|uniref:glycine cleavage system aminomethyltransferase GcvT n=1 Tax=Alphaproteobacteria TaxID=28211 RepID=UPI0027303BDC|nr:MULTISPECIES: glycine cleavage system aminomethyltransferase GcvT [Alphaproteobacteria]MDP1626747.1 glycine cleavage system aminomethyltransferase GcvT [Parvibaculum sp.]MDP2213825.1 glycine cleavage system aminomethyltransferase GcvT [Phenylobacterium sp.]MDP3329790.1 glycine cleavage system aminomethyltransferase GcvT [Parvibaculum sp.]